MLTEQIIRHLYGVMQFPNVPSHERYGWKVDEDGSIDYEWTGCFIVTQNLIDLLNAEPSNDTCGEEVEEEEIRIMIDIVYEDESDENG